MASSKNITITLKGYVVYKKESGGSTAQEKIVNATQPEAGTSALGGDESSPLGMIQQSVKSLITNTTAVAYGAKICKDLLTFGLENVNITLQSHDNYKAQTTLNRAKQYLSYGVSSVATIASGFILGGPVGGALAIASVAVSSITNAYTANREQQLAIDTQNTQMDLARVRSGYSLNSGSIGGDK